MSQPRELLPSYDYVVCGGGAAGCVVASRLAQDSDATVLLLEAGGDERVPAVEDSRVWMSNIGSERDWQFVAEASPHTAGRRLPLPMGRVLGGGSSTNGLIWARGHKNDFELWARESGDARWSYEQVLQVYKRIENWQGTPDPQRRGTGGPMFITKPQDPVPVAQALARACVAAGIPEVDDLNGAAMEGDGACGIANVNVAAGARRVSVAGAYLRPAMARPNLTVLLHAQVRRLVLDGQTVKGVEFSHQGEVLEVAVDAEAVLCTGAINTPKILMLSGIGDRVDLARHGIDCHHHLPGVGANFQDHILVAGCVWEYHTPEPPRNNAAEFTLFWKSKAGLDRPDLQPVLEECAFGSEVTGPAYGLPSDRAAAWTLAPGLVRPQSRGRVRLASADPGQAPRVEANFLSAPEDVQALMTCVKLCRELGNAPELAPFRRRELMPGELDDKALQAWLRQAAGTYFHQSGTARMGQGDDAVVDGALRVHGVQGLRVADASIMPEVTTGNTHAPCVLIGEQAAQAMLKYTAVAVWEDMMAAVELQGVSKSYDGTTFAIEGLSLQCRQGEMLALLGPSGCGKSTTLKLIAGIERISGGRILFNGKDVSELDTASRNVAMVFEDYALYPHLSVFENIAFPLRIRSYLHSEVQRAVDRIIDLLELQDVRDANVRKLSGGAQQRVSIGRALVREPDLIMFDEPLSHMDAAQKVGLRSEIARLQKAAKLTSVLVTHDQTEAISMADRIAVMDKGVLQQVATAAEIYARPANLFVASFIGEPPMNLLPAELLASDASGVLLALAGGAQLALPLVPHGAILQGATGRELVVGIRPEHVQLATQARADIPAFDACIDTVETRGDHDVLQLQSAMGPLVMEVNGPSGFLAGQTLRFQVEPRHVHVFDAKTTRNLLGEQA